MCMCVSCATSSEQVGVCASCVCASCALPALLMCLGSSQLQLGAFVMNMELATRLERAPAPATAATCPSSSFPFAQEALFQFPPFRFSYQTHSHTHTQRESGSKRRDTPLLFDVSVLMSHCPLSLLISNGQLNSTLLHFSNNSNNHSIVSPPNS